MRGGIISMTKVYEDVKELLQDQLKKLAKKSDINATELHNIYEAVDVLKDISTIEAMEKADKEYGEYSNNYSNDYSNEYSQRQGVKGTGRYSREYSQHYMPMWAYDGMSNNSYANMSNQMRTNDNGMSNGGMSNDGMSNNSYDNSYENYSNRRGRDARTGRYVSRDSGYSRAKEKEHMLDRLDDMLDDASSEKERRALEQCIERISK